MLQDFTPLSPVSIVLLIPQTHKYDQVSHLKKNSSLNSTIPQYYPLSPPLCNDLEKQGLFAFIFPTSYLFFNPMQFGLCPHPSSDPTFTDVTNDLSAKSSKFFSVLTILDLSISLDTIAFLYLQTLFSKVLSHIFYWFSIYLPHFLNFLPRLHCH